MDMSKRGLWLGGVIAVAMSAAIFAAACAADPEVVEVIKEVQVEKEVIKEVVVEVEKIVVATPEPTLALSSAPDCPCKQGGTVRTAWGATTRHFDIQQGGSSNVLTQMYNNLVRANPSDGLRTIIPELAESWDISPDTLTFTFNLRKGVEFHDGTPFTADDVVATYSRIISPPEGVTSTQKSVFDATSGVEAVDDHTARFTLREPRAWMFEMLTSPAAIIYSKKSLEENNNDLREVIVPGTGPFIFKEHNPKEFWLFERNPDYWNPSLPYVDVAKMQHVPAWTDRGTAVLTNQADFSWNVSKDTFEEGQKRSDIVDVQLIPACTPLDLKWNNERSPYDDVRVRRAIHLAINRHDASVVYREEWQDVSRWMPRGSEGETPPLELFDLQGYAKDNSADIEEAQRLLAQAGFPEGKGFHKVDLVVASVPGHSQVLAPFFADQLKRTLSIEVAIRTVERALVAQEYKKDFDMVLGTLGNPGCTSVPTPLWNVAWRTGGSQNWSKYSNAEFDSVVEQLNSEVDSAKIRQLLRKGEELLDADPPQYHFGFNSHLPMWRNNVKGLVLDQRVHAEWGRFETVWLDR
jgi:peptide/nickel transport system substrate-binding protein